MKNRKPTKEEIQAAYGKTVPDILAPDLCVLFCGINPGLYSGAVGHHFAWPGNRFWKAIHKAGFTDEVLEPDEGEKLLEHGYGITNFVERATGRASELSPEELAAGAHILEDKVRRYKPHCVAVLGISAYRQAFNLPKAQIGRQPERLGGAILWVLPNPSGLNAHFQVDDLAALFKEMKKDCDDKRCAG